MPSAYDMAKRRFNCSFTPLVRVPPTLPDLALSLRAGGAGEKSGGEADEELKRSISRSIRKPISAVVSGGAKLRKRANLSCDAGPAREENCELLPLVRGLTVCRGLLLGSTKLDRELSAAFDNGRARHHAGDHKKKILLQQALLGDSFRPPVRKRPRDDVQFPIAIKSLLVRSDPDSGQRIKRPRQAPEMKTGLRLILRRRVEESLKLRLKTKGKEATRIVTLTQKKPESPLLEPLEEEPDSGRWQFKVSVKKKGEAE